MINGGECAEAVVAQPEVGASCFGRHLHGQEEALAVDPLRQAVEHAGD